MEAEVVYEGSHTVLRLEPWMLVSHLKLLVEGHFGLPTVLQSLGIEGSCDSSPAITALRSDCERPTVTVRLATNAPIHLRVCPISADPFYISVRLQDSVDHVKEEIRRLTGISPMVQKLLFGQLLLRHSQQLSEAYIPGSGKLDLWSPRDFSVSVMVTDIIHQVPISPSDTLDQAVGKIEHAAGIDCRYRRLMSGSFLVCSGADLKALRVRDGTLLSLTDPPQRFLWLQAIGSEAVRIDYSPTDTIADIGAAVKAERRIESGIKILSKGCICPENMRVDDCALVCGQWVDYGSMIITFRTSLCETVTLAVFPHNPISAIKETVRVRLNLPKLPITLVYEGLELPDEFTLSAIQHTEGAAIEVLQQFDQFVWLVTAARMKVEVDFSRSVDSAFREFAVGIEPQSVRYWSSWKFLQAEQSLAANNIHPGAVIHIIDSANCDRFAAVHSTECTFHGLLEETDNSPFRIQPLQRKLELQSLARFPAFNPETELRCEMLPIRAVLSSERYYDFRSTNNVQKTTAVDPLRPGFKVKEALEAEFSIPFSQMLLISKGQVLQENSPIGGIKEGRVITVCRIGEVSLTIINQVNSIDVVLLESLEVTVQQVKSLYQPQLTSPLILFYKKERLDEKRRLSDYGIMNGSCIRAVTLSDYIATVSSMHGSKYAFLWQFGNRVHQIWFDGSEDTRDIMEKAGKALGFGCGKIVVLYEGEKFVNSFNFQLRTGRVVQVLKEFDEAVVVSREHSPVLFTAISPSATVNELKVKLNLGAAKLSCDGKLLKNRSEIQQYQITPFSVVEEISPLDGVFRVRLRGLASVDIVQKQEKVTTVGALKQRLAECNEPTSRIYVNGELAKDSAVLAEHSELLALDQESVRVLITSFRGSRVSLGFHPSSPISALREAISANIMIFGPYHQLVYNGEVLCDTAKTLKDYCVSEECLIMIKEPDNPWAFLQTKNGRRVVIYPTYQSSELTKEIVMQQDASIKESGELMIIPDSAPADANFPWQLVYCSPGEAAVVLKPPGSAESLIVVVSQITVTALASAVAARTEMEDARFSWFGEVPEGKRIREYQEVDSVFCLCEQSDSSAQNSALYHSAEIKEDGEVINASLQQSGLFQNPKFVDQMIIAETTQGVKIPVKVQLSQKISKLKESFSANFQEVIDLYYNDQLLLDNYTLQQCGIPSGATVQVLTKHDCRLSVRSAISRPLTLYLQKSTLESEVKSRVGEILNQSAKSFRLCCSIEFARDADFSFLPRTGGFYTFNIFFPQLASDEVLLMLEDAPHFPVPIIANEKETIEGVRKRAEHILEKQVKSLTCRGQLLPEHQTVQQSELKTFTKIAYF